MQRLRIFNPEHDLALAFGGTNYTPPPMARLLHRDLQMLPAWISNKNDFILSQNPEIDNNWLDTINTKFNIKTNIATINDIPKFNKIEPWGWNLFLKRRLSLDRAKDEALPSECDIDNIRRLSHRRISIEIHRHFLEKIPTLQDNTPCEFSNIKDVLDFARKYPKAYTKAPWSSSGKGIYRALDITGLDFTRWCNGIIKRQGSIICEKPLNSVLDIAMEFKCENNNTSFIGYSVFNNDAHCSFNNSLLMATSLLHKKIASVLGNDDLLLNVRYNAINILNSLIAPYYTGYAGIDMMIYIDDAGQRQINPCIELNLRTTMGIISCIIGNNFIENSSQGTFNVEFHKSAISPDYIKHLEQQYPLHISNNGKIISGVQFLTPLYSDSQYCSYININK